MSKRTTESKCNTFRILCPVQGANERELDDIAAQLTSMGLVALDPTTLTGPCIYYGSGERFHKNDSADEKWAVALLYTGRASRSQPEQAGMKVEFEGEIICTPEGVRVKGSGSSVFTNPRTAWVADPEFHEPQYYAADPTIRFPALLNVDQIDDFVVPSRKGINHEDSLLADPRLRLPPPAFGIDRAARRAILDSWPVGLLAGPIQSRSTAGRQTCLWSGLCFFRAVSLSSLVLRHSHADCDGGSNVIQLCGSQYSTSLDESLFGDGLHLECICS
jgi:hypothetical protein